MTGRLAGKVALITGAARGQGRSHAVRLAEEGADIVALDLCADIGSVPYGLATNEDLEATVREVERLDRRIVAIRADVRDQAALDAAVTEALATFEHIDVACANAGILNYSPTWEVTEQAWQDVVGVVLTGTFHTVKAVIPAMIEAGRGGSILFTGSVAAEKGAAGCAPYAAAKAGLIGLAKTLAGELAPHNIRVNVVMPASVHTPMLENEATIRLFRPDLANPTFSDMREVLDQMHPLPTPHLFPSDVSNAIAWLASEEARFITGITLPIDAGWLGR